MKCEEVSDVLSPSEWISLATWLQIDLGELMSMSVQELVTRVGGRARQVPARPARWLGMWHISKIIG